MNTKKGAKIIPNEPIILKSVSITDDSSNNWHENFHKVLIYNMKQIKSCFVNLTNENEGS